MTDIYIWFAEGYSRPQRFIRAWTDNPARAASLRDAIGKEPTRYTSHVGASVPNIASMVNRFLGWKLPQDFAPDAGISFKPPSNPDWWPVGTNLFHAEQARQMFEYVCATAEPSDDAMAMSDALRMDDEGRIDERCPSRATAAPSGEAQPVATLHDDGYYTWNRKVPKPDGYDRAGWCMDVYASAALDNRLAKVGERFMRLCFDLGCPSGVNMLDWARERINIAALTREAQAGYIDPLSDFKEGQWWVLELDAWARTGTDEQKRAVAVVHHMLRSASATAPVGAGKELTELRHQILTIHRRHEPLGGQTYSYVKLEEVLAVIDAARAADTPGEIMSQNVHSNAVHCGYCGSTEFVSRGICRDCEMRRRPAPAATDSAHPADAPAEDVAERYARIWDECHPQPEAAPDAAPVAGEREDWLDDVRRAIRVYAHACCYEKANVHIASAELEKLLARAALQPAAPKALTEIEQDDFDVVVKELAENHMVDRTAAGGWIFENHNLYKFAYGLLRAASPQDGEPKALTELSNIASAKRFDRETFADDTEFADWAQNRARALLRAASIKKDGK